MVKIKNVLKQENIGAGYLYFYIHFITEIACFFCLSNIIGSTAYLWVIHLIYDALAFVPQSVIGYISDKNSKINMGLIGVCLLIVALIMFWLRIFDAYLALILLCIGNACIHVNGAEVTLRCSNGKLSHSALFVSGGSFGVISGKLLQKISMPYIVIIILCITTIPFILLAEYYRKEADLKSSHPCEKFNYNSKKASLGLIVILSILIVIVRGYMGYGIPTSWNKTTFQTILLFSFMGIGKALGGIVADIIGVKKTAIISATLALPFLLFGDNFMIISLIGVMLFSMTMSITLALLVSVLKDTPGLAFGLTTIGLFLGTVPVFFIRFTTVLSNCIVITILTILCLVIMNSIIRSDKDV